MWKLSYLPVEEASVLVQLVEEPQHDLSGLAEDSPQQKQLGLGHLLVLYPTDGLERLELSEAAWSWRELLQFETGLEFPKMVELHFSSPGRVGEISLFQS